MYFFIHHEDKDGAQALRMANREAHLAYAKGFHLLVGGPTLSEDGEQMNGSVLIVELPDEDAARDFVANDPYVSAGLFKKTTVKKWRKVIVDGAAV